MHATLGKRGLLSKGCWMLPLAVGTHTQCKDSPALTDLARALEELFACYLGTLPCEAEGFRA